MIRIGRIIFVVLLLMTLIFAAVSYGQSKLSPALAGLVSSYSDIEQTGQASFFGLKKSSDHRNLLPVIIYKTPGSNLEDKISACGGTVGTNLDEWCTADLPLDQIANLAAEAVVVYLDVAPRAEMKLDKSVEIIRANLVQQGSSPLTQAYQGENVVVGIVDSGIDIAHPDFQNADGTSRIKYLWDQTVDGNPPTGFAYGKEWSKQNIDAGVCTELDNGESQGHGTHVAGIAAGNGFAIGKYAGVAPKSDLIVVKSDLSFAHIIDGIQYIFTQAGDRPAVVNLSLATHQGSHDDASPVAKIINQMVGAGKIVVAAASNEGDKAIHVGYQTNATTVQGTGFVAPSNSQDYIDLDLWYPLTGNINFAIGGIDANHNWLTQTSWVIPGQGINKVRFQAGGKTYGLVTIDATETNNPVNHEHHVYIEISNAQEQYNFSASAITWVLMTKGSGSFNGWVYDNSSLFNESSGSVAQVQFVAGDNRLTIGIPGTASRVLTVGAFTTKTNWTSANGNSYMVNATQGDRSVFSSIGPTQDNRIKPDIMAPGFVIASALSKDTDILTTIPARVLPGEKHWVIQGTSMAAPHVTGAAALLLQQNPTLTPEEMNQLFQENATYDSFTGTVPNVYWGAGKLDVFAAMMALSTISSVTAPAELPQEWWLGQNYPNPVQVAKIRTGVMVTVPFMLARAASADLTIYDLLGREIRKFQIQAIQDHPRGDVVWDGSNEQGNLVNPGVYFYRLQVGSKTQTHKLMVVP